MLWQAWQQLPILLGRDENDRSRTFASTILQFDQRHEIALDFKVSSAYCALEKRVEDSLRIRRGFWRQRTRLVSLLSRKVMKASTHRGKKHSPGQVVNLLRQIEVPVGNEKTTTLVREATRHRTAPFLDSYEVVFLAV